jgi:hypothetical protein
MARCGKQPSQLLQALVAHLSPHIPDRQTMVRFLTEAFCFKDGQAYPVFRWAPDGSGELKTLTLTTCYPNELENPATSGT